jgi:UDPglucose--hexose-1-phosphate uridylyltransferase
MPIRFERHEKIARYLDPRADFQEVSLPCEIRRDPLTGRSGRVAHVGGTQLVRPDLESLIEASRSTCPFCPERIFTVTPRFPADVLPEGRLQQGEAVLVPNLSPYDEHSVVAVMSQAHYVPIGAFSQALLRDAFGVCQQYVRGTRHLPRTTYSLVFWNYFPASGGTLIHPHLQIFATDAPGNALEDELLFSQRYYQENGRPYWADLLAEEERLGERFVAQGTHTAWLTSFVSQSVLADTLILFPGQTTFADLGEEALDEFCRGLGQALRHLDAQGVYSFNLACFSGVAGREDSWLHVRLSPRIYMTPRIWGGDTGALQHLYQEHFMMQTPEALAAMLRQAITL